MFSIVRLHSAYTATVVLHPCDLSFEFDASKSFEQQGIDYKLSDCDDFYIVTTPNGPSPLRISAVDDELETLADKMSDAARILGMPQLVGVVTTTNDYCLVPYDTYRTVKQRANLSRRFPAETSTIEVGSYGMLYYNHMASRPHQAELITVDGTRVLVDTSIFDNPLDTSEPVEIDGHSYSEGLIRHLQDMLRSGETSSEWKGYEIEVANGSINITYDMCYAIPMKLLISNL